MEIWDIHIGALIEEKLNEQERSIVWLAKKVNYSRSNLSKILKQSYIDTNLLTRISKALKHDFFNYYSHYLRANNYICSD